MLKINFTEDDAEFLCMIQGPVWQDTCQHKAEEYVVSFQTYSMKAQRQYDLYIYSEGERGQQICIRYGNRCDEYLSCGSLSDFFISHGVSYHEPHATAIKILRHYGKLVWSLDPK